MGDDNQMYGNYIDIFTAIVHERSMVLRMIFRALILSGLALGLAACGDISISEGASEKVADARARNDGPAIWVAKDYDSTVYFFGTVHLLPDGLSWLRDDVRAAFGEAGTVYFEVDTATQGQIEASVLTQSLGMRSDGRRLSDNLDSYQLKLLDAAAHNGDIPLASLESMKPWLASEFLTVAAAVNAGLSPELAADAALKSRAAREQKNVIYLETMEEQIRTSADQPDFVQMKILTDTLGNFNALGGDLNRIVSAWSVGQTGFLTREMVLKLKERSPDFYKALLTDRNKKWAKVLTRYMEGSGTAFVAVGASHLLGEDSLLQMLRDQGYDVSRYYAFQGENVINPVNPTIIRPDRANQ